MTARLQGFAFDPRALRAVAAALLIVAWMTPARAVATEPKAAPFRPNVILITVNAYPLTDPSEYSETPLVKTPSIERLGRTGVRLLQGYAADGMAKRSEPAQLSGRYEQRLYDGRRAPSTERMIPQHFKPLGYATALIGRWEVGVEGTQDANPGMHPMDWGFIA